MEKFSAYRDKGKRKTTIIEKQDCVTLTIHDYNIPRVCHVLKYYRIRDSTLPPNTCRACTTLPTVSRLPLCRSHTLLDRVHPVVFLLFAMATHRRDRQERFTLVYHGRAGHMVD